MINPRKHRSTLNMTSSRRKARGRLRRLSQPRKRMKKHKFSRIAREVVMTRITVGRYTQI